MWQLMTFQKAVTDLCQCHLVEEFWKRTERVKSWETAHEMLMGEK